MGDCGKMTQPDHKFGKIFEKLYFDEFKKEVFRKMKHNIELSAVWYQVYGPNSSSYHGWHKHLTNNRHDPRKFSSVLLLELPDEKLTTKFVDEQSGIEFTPKVKERETLVFGSNILHCSPPNNTNKRKTVISFNWNIV